jgi:hypothetical protein
LPEVLFVWIETIGDDGKRAFALLFARFICPVIVSGGVVREYEPP